MNSFNDHTPGKVQFSWLKVIGALAVLWLTAKVIGAVLSPGFLILALVIWLIVRSQRNKTPKPVVHFVPASGHFAGPAAHHSAPVQYGAPVPPAGYWMPQPSAANPTVVHAFVARPTSPTPQAASAPILDVRTQAEREIEEYVQSSWPNV
jgi:hypothetical protein